MMKGKALVLLALVHLSGCGGGGGGTPVVPAPVVTSVVPSSAMIGTTTVFEVGGTNLPDGMHFTLAGCNAPVELAGGSSTRRQFSCTPVGAITSYQGQVSAAGNSTSALYSFAVSYEAPIASVSLDLNLVAVVKADGSLWTWGGPIGDGTYNLALTPHNVGNGYKSVVVGGSALAIKNDGSLWSWGSGPGLGTDTTTDQLVPVQISTGFAKVGLGGTYGTIGVRALGLKSDGTLWAWGTGANPATPWAIQRTPLQFAQGFTDISMDVGGGAASALKADGTAWTWLTDTDTAYPAETYIPHMAGGSYTAISQAFNSTYGLRQDGSLWSWDRSAATGSGNAITTYFVTDKVRSVASAAFSTAIIKADNTLWIISGSGSSGFQEQRIPGEYIAVWPGPACTMAEKTDGTLWAWGTCFFGDGTPWHANDPPNVPQQVILPKQ